jgi:hypothetical protein
MMSRRPSQLQAFGLPCAGHLTHLWHRTMPSISRTRMMSFKAEGFPEAGSPPRIRSLYTNRTRSVNPM